MYECMHMYVCTYVHTYVCVYVCVCLCARARARTADVSSCLQVTFDGNSERGSILVYHPYLSETDQVSFPHITTGSFPN
jgi:hypothetical protein